MFFLDGLLKNLSALRVETANAFHHLYTRQKVSKVRTQEDEIEDGHMLLLPEKKNL